MLEQELFCLLTCCTVNLCNFCLEAFTLGCTFAIKYLAVKAVYRQLIGIPIFTWNEIAVLDEPSEETSFMLYSPRDWLRPSESNRFWGSCRIGVQCNRPPLWRIELKCKSKECAGDGRFRCAEIDLKGVILLLNNVRYIKSDGNSRAECGNTTHYAIN